MNNQVASSISNYYLLETTFTNLNSDIYQSLIIFIYHIKSLKYMDLGYVYISLHNKI